MLFQERQQLTICVVAGIAISGFVLFRYLPLRKQMKEFKHAKATQILTVAKSAADDRQLRMLEKQLLELQRKFEEYESDIPEQRDIGEFLRKIADVMHEHRLEEQEVEHRDEIKTERFNCIPVNMRCKGTLPQIFGFFQQLQTLDRLIRIEQVKLFNDRDFNGEISMQARAVIYYRAKV